ncbi:hypothetical protein ACMWP8_29055, partial [Escherichia coli]|uniref:hypothetical protein n=1 Tax=Escherichia coli TaxID=562 RepID=UPI0039DF333A
HGRHSELASLAYCDGHVKTVPFTRLYPVPEAQCTAGSGQGCAALAVRRTDYPDLWPLWE